MIQSQPVLEWFKRKPQDGHDHLFKSRASADADYAEPTTPSHGVVWRYLSRLRIRLRPLHIGAASRLQMGFADVEQIQFLDAVLVVGSIPG